VVESARPTGLRSASLTATCPLRPPVRRRNRARRAGSGNCWPFDARSGGAGKDPDSEGADGSVRIEALQAALEQEKAERGFAECLVKVQSGAAQLALDFLVSEPDIAGFFRAFTKTLVEETNGHACGVWLIDEDSRACDLWMAYLKDRMFTPESDDWQTLVLPRHSMAAHLFS
jgi:hypothetical protein